MGNESEQTDSANELDFDVSVQEADNELAINRGRIIKTADGILLAFAKVTVLLMMILITGNALARYLFNQPIPSSFEVVELYLMVGLIYFAIGPLQSIDGNIKVEVFSNNFKNVTNGVVRIIYLLPILVIFAIISYLTANIAYERWSEGAMIYGAIPIPAHISWWLVAIGSFYLALILLYDLYQTARKIPGLI